MKLVFIPLMYNDTWGDWGDAGFHTMMEDEHKLKEIVSEMYPDLPIYNIGGDQDPVGEYGKGIYEVSNWLVDTGHNVKTRVYSGYRHEIHNYDEIKDEVEAGIISFMDSILDE